VLYRVLHAANEWYGLAVFWLFVTAFIAALTMIFIFPFASLLLVFLGVFALLGAVMIGKVLGAAERGAARSSLRRHACPQCGSSLPPADDAGGQRCETCGGAFCASGAPQPADHARLDAEAAGPDQPAT